MDFKKVNTTEYLAARLGVFQLLKKRLPYIGYAGPVKKDGQYIYTFTDYSTGKKDVRTTFDPDYRYEDGVGAKVVHCHHCESTITSNTLCVDDRFRAWHIRCTNSLEKFTKAKFTRVETTGEAFYDEWIANTQMDIQTTIPKLYECERQGVEG